MARFMLVAVVALVCSAAPALAVNDPFVPGENCAADNSQAVGHPAFVQEQSPVAGAPFSINNPGESTGAKGQANTNAPCATLP